jgi:hypothetical protein
MFRLIQRFFSPWQWLISIVVIVIGVVPVFITDEMNYKADKVAWIGSLNSDSTSSIFLVFWPTAILSLSLFNLCFKRPILQPFIMAFVLSFFAALLGSIMLSVMMWGGDLALFNYMIVLAPALLITRCLLIIKDKHRWMSIVQAVGSGLCILLVIFPWRLWAVQRLSGSQRNSLAKVVFGESFIMTKQAVESCDAFQQYVGSPFTLTINTHTQWRYSDTDRFSYITTNQVIVSRRLLFNFDYIGLNKSGRIEAAMRQKEAFPGNYSHNESIQESSDPFVPELSIQVRLPPVDPNSQDPLTTFDCTPP